MILVYNDFFCVPVNIDPDVQLYIVLFYRGILIAIHDIHGCPRKKDICHKDKTYNIKHTGTLCATKYKTALTAETLCKDCGMPFTTKCLLQVISRTSIDR